MSSPPPNWLKTFDAAARHASFAAAAEELGLTAAAVSQQIRLLEAQLGASLFDRLPRGVALTAVGKAYAQPVRRALQDLSDATEGLFARNKHRLLRVRASISCAALVIAPRLGAFRNAYPEIDVDLSTFVWEDGQDMGHSDIDIRWGFGNWRERSIVHLGHENALVVCSPKAFQAGQNLSDIAAGTLYTITGIAHDWEQLSEHFSLTLPPAARHVRVDSSLIALQALQSDQGAAIVLESFARSFLEQGQVIAPFPERLPIPRSHYVVHRDGVETRPDVVAFTQWMVSLYAPSSAFLPDTGESS